MADDIDHSNDNIQRELEISLAQVSNAPESIPLASIGQCHFCDEPLSNGERFCDSDCRDDYEYVQQRRRANQ